MPKRTDGTEINHIVESLESYTKHKIECWVCQATDSARDTTEQRYARYLFEKGWRLIESEKFGTIGVACPKCVQTPDAERGE